MKIGGRMHKGEQLERQIKGYKRELLTPIDNERRMKLQAAINEAKRQKREWERPH